MKNTIKYFSLISLIFLFTITACNSDTSLSFAEKQKFQSVFLDILIADSAVENAPLRQRDSLKKVYYQQIFKLHDMTEQDYTSYTDRLYDNPGQAQEIYATILDSLNRLKEILDDEIRE